MNEHASPYHCHMQNGTDQQLRTEPGLCVREPRSVHALTAVLAVAIGAILVLSRNVLGPFLLGMLIAYLLLPIVRWLELQIGKHPKLAGFARPIAVGIAVLIALLCIAGVLALVLKPVIENVRSILLNYEDYWTTIQTDQDGLNKVYTNLVPENARIWIDANLGRVGSSLFSGSSGLLQWLFLTSGSIASAVVGFFAIPLFMIYFLLDEPKTIGNLRSGCPRFGPRISVAAFKTMDRILGAYTRGVVIESVIVGVITGIGYWVIGVHLALPLGIIAFAGEIVPIIGPWIAFAISFPVVLATQSDKAILAIVVFAVIQIIEGWVLAPRVRAQSVDFSPTGTLITIAIGGAVAGAIGVVFALPAAAILRALAIYAYNRTLGYDCDTALSMTPMFAGDQISKSGEAAGQSSVATE